MDGTYRYYGSHEGHWQEGVLAGETPDDAVARARREGWAWMVVRDPGGRVGARMRRVFPDPQTATHG